MIQSQMFMTDIISNVIAFSLTEISIRTVHPTNTRGDHVMFLVLSFKLKVSH